MKIKYLGTAAAEGVPAMFCTCEVCEKSKQAGGKNIRTRSQAIIDDKLLLDFPADTYMHMLYGGLNLPEITDCIITHNHSDHLYPADFEMRREGFAYLKKDVPLTVYGTKPSSDDSIKYIERYNLSEEKRVLFQEIEPFTQYNIGGYKIIPLKANHDSKCDPVFYSIGYGEKNMLYANDTGYFPEETWDYLKNIKIKFDFISLDCTQILIHCRDGHMSIDVNEEVKLRLIEIGCADKNTVFCINHFSHNGKATYDELVRIAEKYNFKVSYDGMEIEF